MWPREVKSGFLLVFFAKRNVMTFLLSKYEVFLQQKQVMPSRKDAWRRLEDGLDILPALFRQIERMKRNCAATGKEWLGGSLWGSGPVENRFSYPGEKSIWCAEVQRVTSARSFGMALRCGLMDHWEPWVNKTKNAKEPGRYLVAQCFRNSGTWEETKNKQKSGKQLETLFSMFSFFWHQQEFFIGSFLKNGHMPRHGGTRLDSAPAVIQDGESSVFRFDFRKSVTERRDMAKMRWEKTSRSCEGKFGSSACFASLESPLPHMKTSSLNLWWTSFGRWWVQSLFNAWDSSMVKP